MIIPHINDNCIGTGLCESHCPTVFEVGEDGLGHVIAESVAPAEVGPVRVAVKSCPTRAVSWDEDDTRAAWV